MKSTLRGAAVLLVAIVGLAGCDHTTTTPELASPSADASFDRSGTEGTIYREILNGEFAAFRSSVLEGDELTLRNIWVTQEGGPRRRTILEVLVIRCAPDCFVPSGGVGEIPRGDFQGNLASGYTLVTDLRTNPAFTVEDGQSGIIHLRWTASGIDEQRWSGTQEYRWRQYYRKLSGNERRKSATASGELLGDSYFGDAYGWMGTSRGVSVEFGVDRSGGLR
jgi:hypothetical protein